MPTRPLSLRVDLEDDDWEYVQACARIRKTSVHGLCKRLMHVIAQDQLVLAVLDDDSRQVEGKQYNYRQQHWLWQ